MNETIGLGMGSTAKFEVFATLGPHFFPKLKSKIVLLPWGQTNQPTGPGMVLNVTWLNILGTFGTSFLAKRVNLYQLHVGSELLSDILQRNKTTVLGMVKIAFKIYITSY